MRTRKPAETRKAEIVDTALRLADELGPDRLTTEAVARRVGITQAGIFRHFPKKQALWEAIAGHIAGLMEKRWAGALAARQPADARIRSLIAAQLRLIRATPAIPAILFSRELHSENDALRRAFLALLGRFHRRIATLVRQGIEEGVFRRNLDPDDAAMLIVGLVQGLAVRWSLTRRGFDLLEEGARLLDLQLSGFANPESEHRREERS